MTVGPERWFGATGRRVPPIVLEGSIDLEGALVLDSVEDVHALRDAHDRGIPVVVRASSGEAVKRALSRPEVSCALVPTPDLLDLDLRSLTYG